MNSKTQTLAAVASISAMMTAPALALDADAFGSRLIEVGDYMGTALSYETILAEGDTVRLSGLAVKLPGQQAIQLTADTIFEGVSETADGGYVAQSAIIADIRIENPRAGVALTVFNIIATDIALPAQLSMDSLIETTSELYERVSAGPIMMSSLDGYILINIDSLEIANAAETGSGGLTTAYEIAGFQADLAQIDGGFTGELQRMLAMDQLGGSLRASHTWWPDNGEFVLDHLTVDLEDLGSLSLSLAVDGYTPDRHREIAEIYLKAAALTDAGMKIVDDAQIERMPEALLAEFGGMALSAAALRYDDRSLFSRVIEVVAAREEADPQAITSGLALIVSAALGEVVDHAEFVAMMDEAINAFTIDQQNLEVIIEPDRPVAFSEIPAFADQVEIKDIIDRLGIRVLANQ